MTTTLEYSITLLISLLINRTSPLGIGGHYSGTTVPKTYCSGTPFKATCRPNEVIVMINATYGRMKLNKCVKADLGFLGCYANVLKVADNYCSGKQSCEMMVPNDDLDATQEETKGVGGGKCYKELRLYLEASHVCVRVLKPSAKLCRSAINVQVTAHGGVISSNETDVLRCGSTLSPYILKAQKGQVLNISMIDFGWRENYHASNNDAGKTNCNGKSEYGYIEDLDNKDGANRVRICGGLTRTRQLYVSAGPNVKIVLYEAQLENRDAGFLINYEAIGCPDLIPPKHAWRKRDGNELVIGCNHKMARQTWHLKCDGRNWIGVIGNCTQQLEAAKQASLKSSSGPSLSHVIAIFIIIGIAVLISLAIISVGLYFLKKYKMKPHLTAANMYPADRQIYEEPKYKTREQIYNTTPDAKVPGKRNEYTHIWEYPLPEPCSQHGIPPSQISYELSRDQQAGSQGQSGEQYGGSLDSKTTTDSLSRYYALDQNPTDVFHTSSFT